MRTGVVIVTYNSADKIERCLESCGHLPVVVVDNASGDATCQLVRGHPFATLIANTTNHGFAGAVNQGVGALESDLVLLLNPDAELKTPLDALEAACLAPGTGIAAGQLAGVKDGRPQRGFAFRRFPQPATLIFEVLGFNRLFPSNALNRSYRCFDFDLSQPAEVEQPAGAFLMFRREVWQRLGGFDTQFYPVWFEDVDFCKRAYDLGLKIQYVPQVTALHEGGHSIASLDWSCREVYWYVSLLRYASKHFRPRAFRWVSAAVVLGSLFRTAVGVMSQRSFRPIKVYARVGRLAGSSLISGRVNAVQSLGFTKAVEEQEQ
ncbi:MAG TPA: glycosyltransferase family 2 protein [Bryobacteraceae bacterium]|nr:glycosyltransferase family 2 protein [Bryobacteraceae bacterium]